MKRIALTVGLMLTCVPLLVGCDSGKAPVEGKADQKQEAAPAAKADEKMDAAPAAAATVLKAPAESAGKTQNAEGVDHFEQGHWDVAEGHFRKALQADPNLAVAHFNLALALDKLGKHEEATASFKKAAELAPDNAAITQAPILKKHTGA